MKRKLSLYLLLLMGLNHSSCVEPFNLETHDFKESLVVECTITDELIHQKVKLSLTRKLETYTTVFLSNAQVWISDSSGNTYTFSETESNTYLSDQIFKAVPNVDYILHIVTPDGKKYNSKTEMLTQKVLISDLYGELTTKDDKVGVQIYTDSEEIVESAKFFRYEFEETYKVSVPWEISSTLVLTDVEYYPELEYSIEIVPLEEDIQNCYTTTKHSEIIQADITNFSENIIQKKPIRFIEGDDLMLLHRYSILVKQYTQTYDSYNFYKTLSKLGSLGNILEENQPGFVAGNIFPEENINERVIGFFDISSVDSKRIYFNFGDFDLPPPDQYNNCIVHVLDYNDNTVLDGDLNDRLFLYNSFKNPESTWAYYVDAVTGPFPPFYQVVSPVCGDCTINSSNIRPEFWED